MIRALAVPTSTVSMPTCPRAYICRREGGTAGVDEQHALARGVHGDVGVAAHYHVHRPAQLSHHEVVQGGPGRLLGQGEAVGEAHGNTLDFENVGLLDPGVVFGEVGPVAVAIAVAARAEHGGYVLEPVQHLYDVHVSGVQYQLDAREGLVNLPGELGAGFGNVRVRYESDLQGELSPGFGGAAAIWGPGCEGADCVALRARQSIAATHSGCARGGTGAFFRLPGASNTVVPTPRPFGRPVRQARSTGSGEPQGRPIRQAQGRL